MINLNLPVTFLDISRSIDKKVEMVYINYDDYDVICIAANNKVIDEIDELSDLYVTNFDPTGLFVPIKLFSYLVELTNFINTKFIIIEYNNTFIKNVKDLKKLAKISTNWNNPDLYHVERLSLTKNSIDFKLCNSCKYIDIESTEPKTYHVYDF